MHGLNSSKKEQGFTLIELLIVIGIIGFLAAAVLVAVDPVKRIQDSRDARRFAEANAILNAILNKQVDDRALYNGMATAPIRTHATFAQVIVTSDTGIECDTDATENYPGCNQTLDVGATPAAQKSCVVNISDLGTGAGTAAGASGQAVVTGTGTLFTTQVSVGDTLTTANTGNATCVVLSIASDTSLTCNANLATAFAGTYTVNHPASALFPTYIASAPIDPRGAGATNCAAGSGCATLAVGVTTLGSTNTGYYLHRTNGNRLEVGACQGEQSTGVGAISVKR